MHPSKNTVALMISHTCTWNMILVLFSSDVIYSKNHHIFVNSTSQIGPPDKKADPAITRLFCVDIICGIRLII